MVWGSLSGLNVISQGRVDFRQSAARGQALAQEKARLSSGGSQISQGHAAQGI
jgi:hypothetical protein